MKRILFIIQSFPSERSANVYCDERIMEELKKDGHYEIHCLTFQYNMQPLEEKIDGYFVHRFKRSKFWDLYTWALHHEEVRNSKVILLLNRLVLRIKELIAIPIYPCYEPFVAKKYAKEAIALNKKYKFDIVFAEHYGYETVYAGYKLKEENPDIIYMPVFWDALSGGIGAKYLPLWYTQKKKMAFEKKILLKADHAIALISHKDYLTKLWSKTQFLKKYSFLDIPRFELINTEKIQHSSLLNDKEKMHIVFTGSMGLRSPTYFLDLLSQIENKNIVVWIFTAQKYIEKLKRLSSDYNVDLRIINYVPHKELEKILKDADVLLNFGTDNPCMIPSKIFEYMSYAKPIISTYIIDDDPCIPYFEKYKYALLIKDEEQHKNFQDDIVKLSAFLKNVKYQKIDISTLEELFYLNSPKAYVEVINNLVKGVN